MKNIILLGATGSIGTQTLDLIKNNSEYRLAAFSFGNNITRALEIIKEFSPEMVCGIKYSDVIEIKEQFPNIKITNGDGGLQEIVRYNVEEPIVINALVGAIGLLPTISAITSVRDVYLANKETLVVGGSIVMELAKKNGVKIIPIDSEHSAIYQLLNGTRKEDISKLIITASGGSLRDKSQSELLEVTKEEVLNHPNWKMGEKITVDSATLMNKAFELIEASYLFDIDIDQIQPIIHRESIIHSMVQFKDGSIYAQMATADMHLPIQYALEAPKHINNANVEFLDLVKIGSLHFEEVSFERYPLIQVAIDCFKRKKMYCTILNAANEAAVKLFLEDKIKFFEIGKIVIDTVNDHKYDSFQQGTVEVAKIMTLHNMVYYDIYNQYNK